MSGVIFKLYAGGANFQTSYPLDYGKLKLYFALIRDFMFSRLEFALYGVEVLISINMKKAV